MLQIAAILLVTGVLLNKNGLSVNLIESLKCDVPKVCLLDPDGDLGEVRGPTR